MKIGYLMEAGEADVRRRPLSGPANHVRQVILALKSLGHTVRLLARWDNCLWLSDDPDRFAPVIVPLVDRGPLRRVERAARRIQRELRLPYFNWFESVRFALACRQTLRGFDIFYERIGWVSYGGGLAARWMGIPLVLEENGNHLATMQAIGNAPQGVQRRLEVWLTGKAMRRAAHVVATGQGWREHFIERWGFDPRRVTVVENGSELVTLLRRSALRSFRDNAAGDGHITTLAYVGGFYPWHGVPVLLRAVAGARAAGESLRVVLIGAGQGEAEARRLTGELGLAGVVTFAGHLTAEQFAPLLADADIGVSPYCGWKEFSGLKILDYKSAGLATIASGENGRPPTVRHGETGLIVPPCDEDALRDAIVQLCRDPQRRRQMGRAARMDAEAHHGWEHTARELERIFRQVVAP